MLKTPENLAWVARLFADKSKQIVFHNAKFDLKMFGFEGIDIFGMRAKAHCTMILSKLFNEQGNHDLKYLAVKFLGRASKDKTDISDWIKANKRAFTKEHGRPPNFSDAPMDFVRRRAIWDTKSTLLLFWFLFPRVNKQCGRLYETERRLQFVVIDMENTGIQVDLTRTKALKREAQDAIAILHEALNACVCPLEFKQTKTRKRNGEKVQVEFDIIEPNFNPNSTKYHLPAAFKKLGIPLKYKTKPKKKKDKFGNKTKTAGGNWSFDEYAMIRYMNIKLSSVVRTSSEEGWRFDKWLDAMKKVIHDEELEPKDWFPAYILKLRELTKMVSTYYNRFLSDATDVHKRPDGRRVGVIHCSFNQIEAMTGRFSCARPNLQNIPRILGPRECFIPRVARRLWHFDFEQVEMKLFAHFAQDPFMAKAVEDDIHLAVAAEIYHVRVDQVTKEQRKRAKGVNFGIIYGSGPETMAETLTKKGLTTSIPEATRLVNAYHRRFPSVRRLTMRLERELREFGYVENPFGRRYHIPVRYAYTALNYMCQGTSADLMKVAMVKAWEFMRQHKMRSKLLLQVHDEIAIEMPRNEEPILAPELKPMMEDRTSFYVPITVDAEVVTKRWSKKLKPSELGLTFV